MGAALDASKDKKIRREIQIMKLFRHPHIIKLYEVIETEHDILLIMEYVSGGELFEYIVSHGKMPEDKARRFFQQIIAAVEYLHAHMIVHRDLKPENLLLDDISGSVKIADFGLSNVMEYGAFLKTSCGSPNYAAPEVISGSLYAGSEVDVWSCGVILYALLNARLPFDNDHIPTLFKKIRSGEYTPPTCSAACADLISRCLCVDALKRITIPEIRAHEWFAVNLAPYLAETPRDVTELASLPINDEAVAELQSLMGADNVSYAEIQHALQQPAGADGTVNPLAVAYNLVYDQRTAVDKSVPLPSSSGASLSANPLLLATSPPMNLRLEPPFLDLVPPASLTPLAPLLPLSQYPDVLSTGTSPSDEELFAAKHMWFLGKMSRMSPIDVMREVYRVLLLCDYKWKAVSVYSLQVRCEHDVKLSLQLYKVSNQKHLLDFKKMSGPQLEFFDACHLILRALSI
jgi:5'-AMP-activated protein kinase catalytic alpha subunit